MIELPQVPLLPTDVWNVIVGLIKSYNDLNRIRNVNTQLRKIVDTSDKYLELDIPSRQIFRSLPWHDWYIGNDYIKQVRNFKDPERVINYILVRLPLIDRVFVTNTCYNIIKHPETKYNYQVSKKLIHVIPTLDGEIIDAIKNDEISSISLKKYNKTGNLLTSSSK